MFFNIPYVEWIWTSHPSTWEGKAGGMSSLKPRLCTEDSLGYRERSCVSLRTNKTKQPQQKSWRRGYIDEAEITLGIQLVQLVKPELSQKFTLWRELAVKGPWETPQARTGPGAHLGGALLPPQILWLWSEGLSLSGIPSKAWSTELL